MHDPRFPQARRFTGDNADALKAWLRAASGDVGVPDVAFAITDANASITVAAHGERAYEQHGDVSDFVVLEAPGRVVLAQEPGDGAEARTVALALLSLAHTAGVPDSFWATDSRLLLAAEVLELSTDQARTLATGDANRAGQRG